MVASGGNYVSMCKNIILYMCIYVYIMNIPFLDTQSARFVYHCFAYFRAPTSHEQSFFWGGQRSHTIDFFIRSGEVLRFQANTSEVEQRVYPSKKKGWFRQVFPTLGWPIYRDYVMSLQKYNHLQTAPWEGDR